MYFLEGGGGGYTTNIYAYRESYFDNMCHIFTN